MQASVQQPQVQQNTDDVSQIVKQIADKVAAANPGTNATFVKQILIELAKQSPQVSSQGNVLEEIYSQVSTYPYGIVSQSLARFASLLSTDSSVPLPIVQKIIQERAAQIIAKQAPGVPLQNIESIIIQMALQTSKAQGKAITGQTIFDVANQITHNPNGILTQAIIQLAKQDTHDSGKTGQTVNIIQRVVRTSGGSDEDKDERQEQQQPTPTTDKPTTSTTTTPTSEIKNKPGQSQVAGGIQSIPVTRPVSNAEKFGNWGWTVMQAILPEETFNTIKSVVEQVPNINPSVSRADAILSLGGAALQVLNNGGQSQAFQTFNKLKAEVNSNPTILHKVGELAALYQTGDDVSAAHTSDIIADKLVAGVDPAVAIAETPIPEPTNTATETPTVIAGIGVEAAGALDQSVPENTGATPLPGIIPPPDLGTAAGAAVIEPVQPNVAESLPPPDETLPSEEGGIDAASGTDLAAAAEDTITSAGTPSGEDTDTEGVEEEDESGDEGDAETSSEDEDDEESGGGDEGGDEGGDGGDGGGDEGNN